MKYYHVTHDGLVEMTPEEIREIEAEEKNRPLSESEVLRMLLAHQINNIEVDDETSLRMRAFYPVWEPQKVYSAGEKVQYNKKLFRVIQAHTSQIGWEPSNAASMFECINETNAGTIEDPIPYDGNMSLENGKYYIQNGSVYICNRDTVNPVYNALSDLVGLYVQVIA